MLKPNHGINSFGKTVHVRTIDHLPSHTSVQRFNTSIAIAITKAVGTMWCAYGFAIFDLLSLPTAISNGVATTVSWIAQTFLQLVLLSVIMVGQNIQAEASDRRAGLTFDHLSTVIDKMDETTEGGLKTLIDRLSVMEQLLTQQAPASARHVAPGVDSTSPTE